MKKDKTDKSRVITNGDNWPLKREGKLIPLLDRAAHIDGLYDAIKSKRTGVDEEESQRVKVYDELKKAKDIADTRISELEKKLDREYRISTRELDALKAKCNLTATVQQVLTPILGITDSYISHFLNPEVTFYDQNKDTLSLNSYQTIKRQMVGPLGNFQSLIDINKEKAAEVIFSLAEQGHRLINEQPDKFQDRMMDMRVLYELARELTTSKGISLGAEARLLEMKLYDPELAAEAPIDASFSRLAHEDPTLLIGNYGTIKSLRDVTRAVKSENPLHEEAKVPAGRFVRAMYEIRCNKEVQKPSRNTLTAALAEDSTLIQPTMQAALYFFEGQKNSEIKAQLAEIALSAGLNRSEEERISLYEQATRIRKWKETFAQNETLRNDLFNIRFNLGYNAGFERSMGNVEKAQEYEARLARLQQYE